MIRSKPDAAALEKVREAARAKRAELGLEPVPPEQAEYEANEAARKARRKGKRR